jgi:serine/threonine protein kinase
MSIKSRSRKSTRSSKRTKRRIVRKNGIRKTKKSKKGSRKKSKKRIVRKRKTSHNKNYMIMKGGVMTLQCFDTKLKVIDPELTKKLKVHFGKQNRSFILVNRRLKKKGEGGFSKVCTLGKYKNEANSADKNIGKNFIIKLTKFDTPATKTQEVMGRKIHEKLMNAQLEAARVALTKKEQPPPNYVPNLLFTEETEELLYSIEEDSGKDLINYILASKKNKITNKQLIQMAECIQFMHRNNIVHRDIKLENFMIKDTNIKIIDFGISIDINEIALISAKALDYCGTRGYIAPEVNHGVKVADPDLYKKRDVYSFGRLIAELYHIQNALNLKEQYVDIIKRCCGYSTLIPNSSQEELGIKTNRYGYRTDIETKLEERPTIGNVIEELEKLEPNADDLIRARVAAQLKETHALVPLPGQKCQHSSPRGKCIGQVITGKSYCRFHNCPIQGCKKSKKLRTDSDCGNSHEHSDA